MPDRAELRTLRAVPPIYPEDALSAKVSGTVVVEVGIDPDGTVLRAIPISGPKVLQRAALSAALWWGFNSIVTAQDRTARLVFNFNYFPDDLPATALVPVFLPPFTVQLNGSGSQVNNTPIKVRAPLADPSPSRASEQIKIIGLSVAYQLLPPVSRHQLGANGRDYDLVIKVISVLSGEESAKYIRMRYRHTKDDPDLPSYFNDGTSWWLLPLRREPYCDNALTFEVPVVSSDGEVHALFSAFRRPPGTEFEPLPTAVLPCYVLEPPKAQPRTSR